ncbi:cell envelope integrity protein CreD [Massilia glaciei]|uniref:Cell envelope integrity protein CreD n=1 Tax=Massilia glaciei TaxID=1524097 RepID=A0A2U2I524_9BURK|nr:cell envelope integrity protein CreD [Massilia glaciei]PWF54890.1 cell envelope integrity protein CreD [Massilia glaciei]
MQKTLLFKILFILGLMLLILIPLGMIDETIGQRGEFRAQAVAGIAAENVREQTVVGPILVRPYTEDYVEKVEETEKGVTTVRLEKRSVDRRQIVYPNELQVAGEVLIERRYRGIHKVLVYGGRHGFKGDFVLPAGADLARNSPTSTITWGKPFVALAIDDVRGIKNIPTLQLGTQEAEFRAGTGLNASKSGLHASIAPDQLLDDARLPFSFQLRLDGIERLSFVPIAKNNAVKLGSNWPHPQFGGNFLPEIANRVIGQNGFKAQWNISSLATDAQGQFTLLENAGGARGVAGLDSFRVGFIEPINVYSMAERATKYGLLFVALTFAAFFLFEVLKQLPVHPIQYLLVGLALVLFFLLLVSLSEHIAFGLAYVIATIVCVVLIGFYLAAVLRDGKRGMGFGAALGLLYAALYGLLISENNALVLGSLLLFALLAGLMVATRKVDWYQVARSNAAAAVAQSPAAAPVSG